MNGLDAVLMFAAAALIAIVAINWNRMRLERVVTCRTHFLPDETVLRAKVVLSSRAFSRTFPFVTRVERTTDCRRVFGRRGFVEQLLMGGWHVSSTCESLPRHIADDIDRFLRTNDVPEELAATPGEKVFYVSTVYARDVEGGEFSVYAHITEPEYRFDVPFSPGRYAGDVVCRIEAGSKEEAISEAKRARWEFDGDFAPQDRA